MAEYWFHVGRYWLPPRGVNSILHFQSSFDLSLNFVLNQKLLDFKPIMPFEYTFGLKSVFYYRFRRIAPRLFLQFFDDHRFLIGGGGSSQRLQRIWPLLKSRLHDIDRMISISRDLQSRLRRDNIWIVWL